MKQSIVQKLKPAIVEVHKTQHDQDMIAVKEAARHDRERDKRKP